MLKGFKIIGHRGFGPTNNSNNPDLIEYPENTLKSFQYVLDNGADGIELDVYSSADDIAVVIHDERLHDHVIDEQKQQAGLKPVSQYAYQELKGFDLYKNQKIPSLREVLDLVAEYDEKIINLDVKDPKTVPLILNEMERLGKPHINQVIVSSYKWDILRDFRSRNAHINLVPAIKSALLFGKGNIEKDTYKPLVDKYQDNFEKPVLEFHKDIGAYAFDCSITDYTPELIDLAASQGVGLQLSTGMKRVSAQETEYDVLQELHTAAQQKIPFAICKVDEPQLVKENLGSQF